MSAAFVKAPADGGAAPDRTAASNAIIKTRPMTRTNCEAGRFTISFLRLVFLFKGVVIPKSSLLYHHRPAR
jgi:hypothetical protein